MEVIKRVESSVKNRVKGDDIGYWMVDKVGKGWVECGSGIKSGLSV